MNRKVIEACLHFFYMESLYLPLREEAFGLPFFSLLEEKKACLLASQSAIGVTVLRACGFHQTIYISPQFLLLERRGH